LFLLLNVPLMGGFVAFHRLDHKGAGQVGAEDGEKKEFALPA
jgi:hypothetical protein